MTASASPSLIAALHTDRPAPDRADKMGLYGWLVGRWEMDTAVYDDNGAKQTGRGEVHAGWDPGLDAWHILWSDPVRQYYARQIGRARGNDIVQEGKNDAGDTIRWSFTEITPNSFRWRGERASDGGWRLQAEFFARRVG